MISKGRIKNGLTARFLIRDRVPFSLIVEPQEADEYAEAFGAERLLVLPFSNLGLGSIPARNWVWEHSLAAGNDRHWILDDNIRQIYRLHRGRRIPCDSGPAFAAVEDFFDRYENIAVGGMNYHMFGVAGSPPFRRNVHVYSALLILNRIDYRWRGRYNEDTDLCLQVLAGGWCTVLVNAFLIEKMMTMKMTGGNLSDLYQGDGRLKMARSLERNWPGVISVDRRFRRPQHVVNGAWKKFDTELKLKHGINLAEIPPNEYGTRLVELKPVQSDALRRAFGLPLS